MRRAAKLFSCALWLAFAGVPSCAAPRGASDPPAPQKSPAPAMPAAPVQGGAEKPVVPVRQPSSDPGPGYVRPAWNAQSKPPVSTKVLSYPIDWRGTQKIQGLAMVGDRLYSVDDRLYSVPLASGSAWVALAEFPTGGLNALSSDGARLLVGDRDGEVFGFDPSRHQIASLGTFGSGITGLGMAGSRVAVGSAANGVSLASIDHPGVTRLRADDPRAQAVSALAVGADAVFTVGNHALWAWPLSGAPAWEVPGADGATTVIARQGIVYVGTADGWVLRSMDGGHSLQALQHPVDTPISALATDGGWLYSASGNTTYMQEQTHWQVSLCHPGFAGAISTMAILNSERVLVGTEKGLFWMPR